MRKVKVLLSALLVLMVSSFAFAYDGTVYGDSFGKFSRKEFMEAASDDEYARELVETATDGAEIERFYNVNEDNLDEEDLELINDVEAYISDTYKVRNRDCYFHIIVRGETPNGWDGWMIMTNYSESASSEFFHYIYYFAVEE